MKKNPGETQKCTRCGKTKPLPEFRRQSHTKSGRDTICKACRTAHDREVKRKSFGPLAEPEGSEEWVQEIRRRAEVIKNENIKKMRDKG